MRFVSIFVFINVLIFFLVQPVFADGTPTPTPTLTQSQVEQQQADTSKQDSSKIVSSMIDYVKAVDNFVAGGLVFTTPDIFADTITLPGGGQFGGFNNYRSVFVAIAIGIVSIIIAIIGISAMFEESAFQLQPFLFRLLLTGGLFAFVPFLLGLTIQGTNILNNQILSLGQQSATTTDVTQTIVNILTDFIKQMGAGASPSSFGLPTAQISIFGNFIQSVGLFLFQLFVLFITAIFFILGFLFILFQFVIRFVSLLFLSILYPFVIPFALSSKTQGVVKAYFMAWISFLIHQPAFILGFMIVTAIFNGLLKTSGASLGMLFLYSGSLFFLGGVNALITRIFGEPWTAIGTNIQAAIATAGVSAPVSRFTQGLTGGYVTGFTSLAGQTVSKKLGWLSRDGRNFSFTGGNKEDQNGQTSPQDTSNFQGSGSQKSGVGSRKAFVPSLTQEIQQKGIQAEVVNRKLGTVNIPKTPAYAYTDTKTGLVTNYLSKEDALQDGHKPTDIKKTVIEGKYADYSAFHNTGVKNPYNTVATRVKKETGFTGQSHAKFSGSPDWINDHMSLTKEKFQTDGIQGIIGKRNGNFNGIQNKEKIVRIYTKE